MVGAGSTQKSESVGDSQFPVQTSLTEDRAARAGPSEHGQWNGDGDVAAERQRRAWRQQTLGEGNERPQAHMPICPTSTSFSNLRAVAPLWVKMAVPLPSVRMKSGGGQWRPNQGQPGRSISVHLLELMTLIASSRSFALTIVSTGPKISSLRTNESARLSTVTLRPTHW